MTPQEAAAYISQAIIEEQSKSTFGAANIKAVYFQAYRVGITEDQVKEYLAISGYQLAQFGRDYYIKPLNP